MPNFALFISQFKKKSLQAELNLFLVNKGIWLFNNEFVCI